MADPTLFKVFLESYDVSAVARTQLSAVLRDFQEYTLDRMTQRREDILRNKIGKADEEIQYIE